MSDVPQIVEFRRELMADVDEEMGERVLLSFFAGSDVDPLRPQMTITARLKTGPSKDSTLANDRRQDWAVELSAGTGELMINPRAYPDLKIRKGDMVKPLDRAGEKWWAVDHLDPRGATRLVVGLIEE